MTATGNQENVRVFFDHDAGRYLTQRYPCQLKTCDQYSYAVRKSYVLSMLDNSCANPGQILDVGCGPGVYTKDLLARGWAVWGIDLSPQMLEVAKHSLSHVDGANRVQFRVAQVTALPFDASFFDAVLCIGVISYVEDIDRAMSEIARVLKPGGHVIFQVSNKLSPFELEVRLRGWLRPLRSRRSEKEDDRLLDRMKLVAYRPAAFDVRCTQHGFRKRDFRYYSFYLSVMDAVCPGVSLSIAKRLEILSRSSTLGWLGAGYLVVMEKA
ncbi:MAG: class I SAM-dependent methyltransferase [Nitrospiraceae bacterium]